jgi:hypothetical protein
VRQLIVNALDSNRIDQAFPLVQTAWPHVSLEHWRQFARDRIAGPPYISGIQCVVTEQNYIAGLCVYRVERHLCHGPTVVSDQFIALDLFNRAAIVNALADFLEGMAREQKCGAIHTQIQEHAKQWEGPEDCMVSILRARGHEIRSLQLCKALGLGTAGN